MIKTNSRLVADKIKEAHLPPSDKSGVLSSRT